LRILDTFIAGYDDAAIAGPQKQKRLLKARIEAGEKRDVGKMLTIAVDDKPLGAGCQVGGTASPFIGGWRYFRCCARQAEFRKRDVSQAA